MRPFIWTIITIAEVLIAVAVIVLDLFIPTIVILGLIVISLVIRHEGIASLGFTRARSFAQMAGFVFTSVCIWQLFQIGFTMPVLNHLTGTTQNLNDFSNIKGNLEQFLIFLILSWTLAGFGEEIVYRGYLQKKLSELFGIDRFGLVIMIGVSSLLFGISHTEQGVIGVIVTFLDAIFFSWLKMRFDNNLWAAILAHGFSNSIGLITFYFVGPIYDLW
jgi:membrane protease YdiL (CAAX protease family)